MMANKLTYLLASGVVDDILEFKLTGMAFVGYGGHWLKFFGENLI